MSGLKVEALQREFFYNGTRIPDPAPNLSVEQVRELLTPTWPEIATATLEGPEDTGSALPTHSVGLSVRRGNCAEAANEPRGTDRRLQGQGRGSSESTK